MSDAPLTSDAGLLPLRQFDERIGLTSQFATKEACELLGRLAKGTPGRTV